MPFVSIIVPTYNSEEFLDRVLINLIEQNYSFKEIIVIDNFSTDNTPAIGRRWATKFYQAGSERVAQANFGIRKAYGDLIYLTGSDMLRDIDYVTKAVKEIQKGYDAIYASVLTDWRVDHYLGRVKAMERKSYIGTFIESARFFKKSVWESLGGFDESIIGMEEDFQHKLDRNAYKTGRISAREYHLHEEKNLKQVFKKSYYYGKFMRNYLLKHKKRGWKQLNPARPNLHFFLKEPFLIPGFIVYKITQYLGGILGLLFGRKYAR